ncbi:deoxyribose-phosphate aldolase [Mollicutes bacterium LVI A0078]|nr:deoxyribose-phosphate aldolase [Mollicutes bacterium LVI A0075]WOO90786.1 deoxyribose-phosphate aldolase [Mollicutes bacterium LVI A0078]
MNINKYIDHTALKADTKVAEINSLITEAKEYDFASVCVNPTWVSHAAKELAGTDVKVCTVIGFPLGANTTATKVFETKDAIQNGATEIDMVLNIAALIEGNDQLVEEEIRQIKQACGDITLKVIIETCLLTDEQKRTACKLIMSAGADFVKTSTGFSTGGATKADIELFKAEVEDNCLIKASGGVRTLDDAKVMIEAGANRIGTSGGVSIVNGNENTSDY